MLNTIKNLGKSLPVIRRILRERDELRAQVVQLYRQRDELARQIPSASSGLLSFRAAQPDRFARKAVFENHGYCYCCASIVKFSAYGIWWRDEYLCSNCGSIPRERAIMYCIEQFSPAWHEKVVHESSPVSRGASLRLKAECPGYIASQYYPEILSGTLNQGVRCENLESLTFENNSIDLHVTQDVFEHIFNPQKAFKEIARTLKPGGAHIFTVPIVNKDGPTEVCARMTTDGKIDYLREPAEYHGNPISEKGSLVTSRWGYDICDFIFKASGLFTKVVILDALDLGMRAEYIDVLITLKPPTVSEMNTTL